MQTILTKTMIDLFLASMSDGMRINSSVALVALEAGAEDGERKEKAGKCGLQGLVMIIREYMKIQS